MTFTILTTTRLSAPLDGQLCVWRQANPRPPLLDHSRAQYQRSRLAFVAALLAAACSISGCNEESTDGPLAQNAECVARVIVGLETTPDDAVLATIERASSLELELLGEVPSAHHVYVLRIAGPDDDCLAAIDRLRHDPRVRFVDLDTRRELHDQ